MINTPRQQSITLLIDIIFALNIEHRLAMSNWNLFSRYMYYFFGYFVCIMNKICNKKIEFTSEIDYIMGKINTLNGLKPYNYNSIIISDRAFKNYDNVGNGFNELINYRGDLRKEPAR